MKNQIVARRILSELEKHGSSVYDGLTSYVPSGVINNYRVQETAELKTTSEKKFRDNIELSQRLMAIDPSIYEIDENISYKLIDYIEQRDFDVISELRIELKNKNEEYKEMIKEIKTTSPDEYLSVIDYRRSMEHKIYNAKTFKKKIEYLRAIIKTILSYNSEYDELLIDKPNDMSFLFTNNSGSYDSVSFK